MSITKVYQVFWLKLEKSYVQTKINWALYIQGPFSKWDLEYLLVLVLWKNPENNVWEMDPLRFGSEYFLGRLLQPLK